MGVVRGRVKPQEGSDVVSTDARPVWGAGL